MKKMNSLLASLGAVCLMTGAAMAADDAVVETMVETYAHPTMFGTVAQENVTATGEYVTGGKIANIPLVAIDKNHRGKGFSEHLLNRSIKTVVDWTKLGRKTFSEVNVTTETHNYKALKLYRRIGFREDFCYPQAYLIPKNK